MQSDEAKSRTRRAKEQVQAKNKRGTTPSNQTRRQAGGFMHIFIICIYVYTILYNT